MTCLSHDLGLVVLVEPFLRWLNRPLLSLSLASVVFLSGWRHIFLLLIFYFNGYKTYGLTCGSPICWRIYQLKGKRNAEASR